MKYDVMYMGSWGWIMLITYFIYSTTESECTSLSMAAGLKQQNSTPHSPLVIKATEPTSDNFEIKKFLDWASFDYHDISNQWPKTLA